MRISIIILLYFLSPSIFCQVTITIPISRLNNHFSNGETVYVSKVNYFEYDSDNYLLDSVYVKNDSISFVKNSSNQELIVLKKKNEVPSTFLPLIQIRKEYTSMFCSNFYSDSYYMLLTNEYSQQEHGYLMEFYSMFTRKSFDSRLFRNGNYKTMSIDKALSKIESRKSKFEKHLQEKGPHFSVEFNDYMQTEIELGAYNQFLNWYEEVNEVVLLTGFDETNFSNMHETVYSTVLNKKWNTKSIQYFRMVERILNYNESKKRKKFQTYFAQIPERKTLSAEIIHKTSSKKEK